MLHNLESIVAGAFIDNEFVPVTGGNRVPVVDPAQGAVFTELPEAGVAEVDAAFVGNPGQCG
jgi:acyl-CoA reductase-like NAD-dependent aldehyde dehydrogenase